MFLGRLDWKSSVQCTQLWSNIHGVLDDAVAHDMQVQQWLCHMPAAWFERRELSNSFVGGCQNEQLVRKVLARECHRPLARHVFCSEQWEALQRFLIRSLQNRRYSWIANIVEIVKRCVPLQARNHGFQMALPRSWYGRVSQGYGIWLRNAFYCGWRLFS